MDPQPNARAGARERSRSQRARARQRRARERAMSPQDEDRKSCPVCDNPAWKIYYTPHTGYRFRCVTCGHYEWG
eukprot:4158398-Karenia_brevis.AAC.1